jgi:hypothetical protein
MADPKNQQNANDNLYHLRSASTSSHDFDPSDFEKFMDQKLSDSEPVEPISDLLICHAY